MPSALRDGPKERERPQDVSSRTLGEMKGGRGRGSRGDPPPTPSLTRSGRHKPKGTHLDEKLVAPAVERLKALGRIDVVDEHAAVGPTVEGDAERLEALLAGRIPELYLDEVIRGVGGESEGRGDVRRGDGGSSRSLQRESGKGSGPTCIVTSRSSTMTSLVRLLVPPTGAQEGNGSSG